MPEEKVSFLGHLPDDIEKLFLKSGNFLVLDLHSEDLSFIPIIE